MTVSEFLVWQEFYKLQPFDDRTRFHRPAALVAHAMGGADLGELTAFLAGDAAPAATGEGADGYTAADLATMKAFGVKPPRRA